MELEALKTIWVKVSEEHQKSYSVNEGLIQSMIKQKSNIEIAEIQRTMRTKIVFASLIVLVGIFIVWSMVNIEDFVVFEQFLSKREGIVVWSFCTILIAIVALFMTYSYRRISQLLSYSLGVKTTLEQTLKIMKEVFLVGTLSDAVGSPIIMVWVAYVQIYEEQNFVPDQRVWFLLAFGLGMGLLAYFLNRRVQRNKFGSYLNSLKDCLRDLENLEDA